MHAGIGRDARARPFFPERKPWLPCQETWNDILQLRARQLPAARVCRVFSLSFGRKAGGLSVGLSGGVPPAFVRLRGAAGMVLLLD